MILPKPLPAVADASLSTTGSSLARRWDWDAGQRCAVWIFRRLHSGLLTGVILETGRAIGETMAVLMWFCGNVLQTPKKECEPVLRTLTANIARDEAIR